MHQAISQDDDTDATTVSIRSMILAARQRQEEEAEAVRWLMAALDDRARAYGVVGEVSLAVFATKNGKAIDDRECEPFDPADTEWGVQDDLANLPRKAARCA